MPSPSRILHAAHHAWRMTNPWSPMVRDHRGRPVPLYRVDRAIRQATGASELPASVFDRVRARLLSTSRDGMGSSLGLVAGAAGNIAVYVWTLYQPFPGVDIVRWVLLGTAGLLLISAWMHRYRIPRVRREVIAAALLEEVRCPSCAYDLHAAPPVAGSGPLVLCPECGAAWRLSTPVS